MNIQQLTYEYIESDDSFTSSNNDRIINLYDSLDDATKRKVDSIFINLCGYGLDTIIQETILSKVRQC